LANITKRANKDGRVSYLIRVFVDEKSNGKQTVKSMTYKPDPNLTQRQAEKKANEAAILFEQKVKQGVVAYDGTIKFEAYAAQWMENAQIAPKTREGYEIYLRRINAAIGHIRLQNIQAHHLEAFYKNLAEDGIKDKGRHAVSFGLAELMSEKGISNNKLARLAGVATVTIMTARGGKRISIDSAVKIAAALDIPVKNIFTLVEETAGLSDKTILHHHRLISAILGKAKKERIIPAILTMKKRGVLSACYWMRKIFGLKQQFY
jgi:transcriptional regulator with XRE-family HTH domain